MRYRYWDADYDSLPDPVEQAILTAEASVARNARIRAHNQWCAANPDLAKAKWHRANQESIDKGWGPLPF